MRTTSREQLEALTAHDRERMPALLVAFGEAARYAAALGKDHRPADLVALIHDGSIRTSAPRESWLAREQVRELPGLVDGTLTAMQLQQALSYSEGAFPVVVGHRGRYEIFTLALGPQTGTPRQWSGSAFRPADETATRR